MTATAPAASEVKPCCSSQSRVLAATRAPSKRRRHDDDDLVGLAQDALDGAVEDAGAGVDEDEVVVPVEQLDQPPSSPRSPSESVIRGSSSDAITSSRVRACDV